MTGVADSLRGFGTERGDILDSVLFVMHEEKRSTTPRPGAAGTRRRTPAAVRPASRLAPQRAAPPSPAPIPIETLTDPATGAWTIQALRRDLALERPPQGAGDHRGMAILAVAADSEDALDPSVLRLVVEVGAIVLAPKDRLYRTGEQELTLLLEDAGTTDASDAAARIEVGVAPILAARRLPSVHVRIRPPGTKPSQGPKAQAPPARPRRQHLGAVG